MMQKFLQKLNRFSPAPFVSAHCDGPCGVYDPASARIAAEAVRSMAKKLAALEKPQPNSGDAHRAYLNTFTRYVLIKEEQAEITKRELLILWTDYFKPEHLAQFPNLHDTFWKAAKLCSKNKQEVSETAAKELVDAVHAIAHIFEQTKKK